jgi:MarR family transcriptional regulator, organic hydroperoxide resistance regulator
VPGKLAAEIKQTKPMSLAAEAALNIQRTADHLDAVLTGVLKPFELSGSQYNALRILRGAGKDGLACREIGDRMVSRDPDITRLLDRLEKRGLAERSREIRDRRVVRVRITAAGLNFLKQLERPVEDALTRLIGRLGSERLTRLIEGLESIREPI